MKIRKLLVVTMVCILCVVGLAACGTSKTSGEGKKEEKAATLDLNGNWKQVNSESDDSWQAATIKDGKIEINWVSDNGDTESLYWLGTYEAPEGKTENDTYSWTSKGDKETMDNALLASQEDTKEFKYDGKYLTYKASALGTTATIKLEKQK